jgi:HAD superfamily hydrolase (TIGR01490 family)
MSARNLLERISLSVFDLDRTLTRRPTYSAFLLFVAWQRSPWRIALAPIVAGGMLAYVAKLINRSQLKQLQQRVLIGSSIPTQEIEALAARFSAFVVREWVGEDAMRRIACERSEGRRVVLASAANSVYLDLIARQLGIDEVVATQSTWKNGCLIPQIAGENCYGMAKRDMLIHHFRSQGLERERLHVRFFSDHASDLPTFEWADEPIAVNPSAPLRSIAARQGWEVLRWL